MFRATSESRCSRYGTRTCWDVAERRAPLRAYCLPHLLRRLALGRKALAREPTELKR